MAPWPLCPVGTKEIAVAASSAELEVTNWKGWSGVGHLKIFAIVVETTSECTSVNRSFASSRPTKKL